MKKIHFSNKVKAMFVGALIFAMFGLFLFPWVSYNRKQLDEMDQWPSIKAYIVSADTTSVSRKNQGIKYKQKLQYTYTINEITYINDQIAYGGSAPEWQLETDAKKSLPKIGTEISIRFDPKKPSKSAIYIFTMSDTDENFFHWFSGIFASIGILIFFAGLRMNS